MNKKLMLGMLGLFAISLIAATGYIVSTLTLDVGVEESFTVQYAMLGDAGNYEGSPTCNTYSGDWFNVGDGGSVPTENMYPGESRKLCVKIDNAGVPLTYTVTSKIKTGEGNYADCAIAFPEDTFTGTADKGETRDGQAFTVPGDAPAVENCLIDITVARG